MKHFTLIELGSDAESPMIGTILYIPDTKQGKISFIQRFSEAIKEHFDIEEFSSDKMPDLFCGSPYEDISITIDQIKFEIRILETWSY